MQTYTGERFTHGEAAMLCGRGFPVIVAADADGLAVIINEEQRPENREAIAYLRRLREQVPA